jgi:hypothetical protein
MTSSASIGDFTLLRIKGPVIAAVPPGRDRHAQAHLCHHHAGRRGRPT